MPQHPAPSLTLPPDPVIEAYKKDIDRTLLRETLRLTPAQCLQRLQDFVQAMAMLRGGEAEGVTSFEQLLQSLAARSRYRS